MISDPWIDRAWSARKDVYRTSEDDRLYAKDRRDMLRAAGKCIAGPLVGSVGRNGIEHGPVVKSGRCARCLAVYAEGK